MYLVTLLLILVPPMAVEAGMNESNLTPTLHVSLVVDFVSSASPPCLTVGVVVPMHIWMTQGQIAFEELGLWPRKDPILFRAQDR